MFIRYALFSYNRPVLHLLLVALTIVATVGLMSFTIIYESVLGLMTLPLAGIPIVFFGKVSNVR